MVKNGQPSAVEQMAYRPQGVGAGAVEVMTFDHLRQLNTGGTQRADFHVVAVVTGGRGAASVDFERCQLVRRTVVWIPPGAVHRWDDIADVTGTLVLFTATAPVTAATRQLAADPATPNSWTIAAGDRRLLSTALHHLREEIDAGSTVGVATETPQILLSALLARLRPPTTLPNTAGQALFHQFRTVVETRFREHHSVGYYAEALGYAPRTLSRAVLGATGRTAKDYLTERLVLEAKRLLVHDRFTAARCAQELGFRDASNFSAFFLVATGERPGSWQRGHGG